MKWKEYKVEFEFDGSWRDIYILRTSVSDWQKLIDFCRSKPFQFSYTVDGIESELPEEVNEVFRTWEEASPLLSIQAGAVLLSCHFFTEEKIEFDIDPRAIRNESEAEQVFTFMREIGQLLNKEVILTPENEQSRVVFRFLSRLDQIQYVARDT